MNYFYGNEDVSSKCRKLAENSVFSLAGNQNLNSLFGDPLPNVEKEFKIQCTDGTSITLPEHRNFDISIKITKSLEIVVARYNETLEWMNNFEIFQNHSYTIYNKGPNENFVQNGDNITIQLDNVGRNDHTYLHHIVKNYDCLADVTVFFPGSLQMPFKFIAGVALLRKVQETGKAWMFGKHCKDICKHFEDFQIEKWMCSAGVNRAINSEENLSLAEIRPLGKWYQKYYGSQLTEMFFFHGILSVDRETILKRPLSFYEEMVRQLSLSSNPEVGHYIERTWHAMFPGISVIPLSPDSAFLYSNIMIPNRVFFAAFGTKNCDRIDWQARVSGYFNVVEVFDETRMQKLMNMNVERLLYKPLVIKHMLSLLNNGEILYYCDSTCDILLGDNNLTEIFNAILCGDDYDNVVCLRTGRLEAQFTKMDVLKKIPTVNVTSNQYSPACFILKKTTEIVQLIDCWIDLQSQVENCNAISTEENLPSFIEHDVDSLFSLLLKSHKKTFESRIFFCKNE